MDNLGPQKGRTTEGVWCRIGNLLQNFAPQECAATFETPDTLQCKSERL
jgi:hypothetical protein